MRSAREHLFDALHGPDARLELLEYLIDEMRGCLRTTKSRTLVRGQSSDIVLGLDCAAVQPRCTSWMGPFEALHGRARRRERARRRD